MDLKGGDKMKMVVRTAVGGASLDDDEAHATRTLSAISVEQSTSVAAGEPSGARSDSREQYEEMLAWDGDSDDCFQEEVLVSVPENNEPNKRKRGRCTKSGSVDESSVQSAGNIIQQIESSAKYVKGLLNEKRNKILDEKLELQNKDGVTDCENADKDEDRIADEENDSEEELENDTKSDVGSSAEEKKDEPHIKHVVLIKETQWKHGFQCSSCEEVFDKLNRAREHMKSSHGCDGKQLSCVYCEKKFKIKCDLDRHLNVHVGKRPFPCPECDKAFVCRSSLMRHRKLQHLVGDIFRCHICEKTFRVNSDLQRHLSVHLGKKGFPCKLCDKTFSCKSSLKVHAKIHDESKKFTCKICEKKFHIKSDYERHSDKHSGDFKWECSICGKRYTSKSAVKRHIKDAHIFANSKMSKKHRVKDMQMETEKSDDFDINKIDSYVINRSENQTRLFNNSLGNFQGLEARQDEELN